MPECRPAVHAVLMILAVAAGCTPVSPPGGERDVPCIDTPEWQVVLSSFAVRKEAAESGVLLLTAQHADHDDIDFSDGRQDFIPHLAVYRFDPASEVFEVVEDSRWDAAEPAAQLCCSNSFPELPFYRDGTQLLFDGNDVPVMGGKTLKTSKAPTSAAEAVLSTNGTVNVWFPYASGQHFHQLFSRLDGTPLAPEKRLGMGGLDNDVISFDWTNDEDYVVYEQRTGELPGIGRICIVPVTETLPSYPSQ